MSEPLLRVSNISAGYGRKIVIRDVSLEVPEGGAVGIVGPNGHGKTTLLNCVSAFVPLLGGEIRLGGHRLDGKPPHRVVEYGVVHIPQDNRIFPEMTVHDNLMMGAYLRKSQKDAPERLRYVLTLFPRLEERQKQVASTLSGGERRMLSIGRGLMTGGRLLMIDEPTLGLSPLMAETIYGTLSRLREEGYSILLVDENPMRITEIAEQVYLLDDGSFVWSGNSSELEHSSELLETYLGG